MNTPVPDQSELAWFYTTSDDAIDIKEAGALRPSAGRDERAIVWFSTAETWEPMALRGNYLSPDLPTALRGNYLMVNEQTFSSMEDLIARGAELLRLGIGKGQLFPYPAIFDVAGVPAEVREAAEKAAALAGSDVRQWHGALDAIPFDQLIVQRWDVDSKSWVDAPGLPSLK